jgi:hypothetical protein
MIWKIHRAPLAYAQITDVGTRLALAQTNIFFFLSNQNIKQNKIRGGRSKKFKPAEQKNALLSSNKS